MDKTKVMDIKLDFYLKTNLSDQKTVISEIRLVDKIKLFLSVLI